MLERFGCTIHQHVPLPDAVIVQALWTGKLANYPDGPLEASLSRWGLGCGGGDDVVVGVWW